MMLQEAKNLAKDSQDDAKVSYKETLESEQDKDTAKKEVKEFQRVLEPNKPRTHADTTTTTDDDEECVNQSWDDWDLSDYRRVTTHISFSPGACRMDCVLESSELCSYCQNHCRTHS